MRALNAKFVLLFSFWTFWMALLIIPPALTQNILGIISAVEYTSVYTIGALLLYKRLVMRVKPRYPLSFPGDVDSYFPRFNIPRPIYLDLAEHPEYFEKTNITEN